MKSLKLALLGATLLASAGAVSTANAADVYARQSLKDGPVDYLPAITWRGFYFGANLGAAFNDSDDNGKGKDYCSEKSRCVSYNDGSDDDDDTALIGGIHLGYNWQRSSNLVLGIEGDVDFADDIDYLASLRGRIGLATGPTLFYATGGVAFLGVDDEFNDDDTLTGWVAGLGVEHKLRPNVSVGLEGLYYAFDEDDNSSYNSDDENDFWAVRARLTYHFTDSHADPLK